MAWQRLSIRNGAGTEDSLFEGIPEHLQYPLVEWVRAQFGWFDRGRGVDAKKGLMVTLGSALRLSLRQQYSEGLSQEIINRLTADESLFLDAVDFLLYSTGGTRSQSLQEILEVGGSAWSVNSSKKGLERRVPIAAKAAAEAATAGSALHARELEEAWSCVFGRNPDPSDAWDHAIKALEELLIPIVVKGKPKSNLGTVAGELTNSSHKWHFELEPSGSRNAGETLADMLRLIWPNPDRHGGGTDRRTPSQEEAESAVHLSIAIVEMCRDGRLVKR